MFCSASTQLSSFARASSWRARDVGDAAALALEEREAAHAILAPALERIRLRLELRDLRLDLRERVGRARLLIGRRCLREQLDALEERLGGGDHASTQRLIAGRAASHQAKNLVAILLRALHRCRDTAACRCAFGSKPAARCMPVAAPDAGHGRQRHARRTRKRARAP